MADDLDTFPSALPVRREVPWAGLGHDPDRLRQQLRVLHRAGGARQGDQPALRRHRRARCERAGRRRRHRGHPARPEREQLRPRPHARRPPGRRRRSRPAAVRRAPPGGRRRRRHRAGPLHEPAPEGPAARDDRRHGRDAGGVRAPPPAAPVGQRPGAGRHAPRLHRRALPRAAGRRPRRHRRPGRHHRHHRRLPRRDRRRLRAHPRGGRRGRLRQRLHLHLQPPARHRGRRAGRRASCPPTSWPSASSGCGSWSSAPASPSTRPASGASRRCSSRARRRKDPDVLTGRTRQNKLVHFAVRADPARAATPPSRVTGAAPHHLRGELVEVTRPAAHKTRLPLLVG